MPEYQRVPERSRESELFSLLAASYEFSQKDGKLQADLMRVFRHLHPTVGVTETDIHRFVAEGEATRTDYSAQQQPTLAMRMVKMINNERAHKQLESGLASMRMELPHWEDYFGPFMHEAADDPFPTPEAACQFLLKLIAQDEHYARTGRERSGVKVFYDYFIEQILNAEPLPSGNVMFSKNTLPLFRTYILKKIHEMPHEQLSQVRDALVRLSELHNSTVSDGVQYDVEKLMKRLESM